MNMDDTQRQAARQYADRDIMALDKLGGHYCRHVNAMTAEGLHSKSDIAAELAWRDAEIDRLSALAAAPQSSPDGWIAVTERLPDYGVEVLLYRPDAAKSYDPIYTLRARSKGYPGPFEFECLAVPTHWQFLPQEPEADLLAQPDEGSA